jgi:hypothetical protein
MSRMDIGGDFMPLLGHAYHYGDVFVHVVIALFFVQGMVGCVS